MRAVFMGTPDFSVPVLTAMADDGVDIAAVVTQPDRPKGRGKGTAISPVKAEAQRLGLAVLQPEKARNPEFVQQLRNIAPDVIVVVAFGQILSRDILDIPARGCINVHASLLPDYRGAAPIQYAILDGKKETGVTTMFMGEGVDTGDILLQKIVPIAADETGGSLFDKLSREGAGLLIQTLHELEAGTLHPVRQPEEGRYVGMIKKSMGEIDWTSPAEAIERKIRAFDPWPSAYTYREGGLLKLWKARIQPGRAGEPGTVTAVSKNSFCVQTGDGVLEVLELQPEGRKRMTVDAYLRGYPVKSGERLGR